MPVAAVPMFSGGGMGSAGMPALPSQNPDEQNADNILDDLLEEMEEPEQLGTSLNPAYLTSVGEAVGNAAMAAARTVGGIFGSFMNYTNPEY